MISIATIVEEREEGREEDRDKEDREEGKAGDIISPLGIVVEEDLLSRRERVI